VRRAGRDRREVSAFHFYRRPLARALTPQRTGSLQFRQSASATRSPFDPRFAVFLPIQVTGSLRFHLLAVWSLNFQPKLDLTMPDALCFYERFLQSAEAVVAGDFNNSVFWDRPGKRTNFWELQRPWRTSASPARIMQSPASPLGKNGVRRYGS